MIGTDDWFSQGPYRCRFDWGRRGVRDAAARGDVLVVVDVLSFSTAVATAVERGGVVYPCGEAEDARRLAERVGGEPAVHRRDVPARGRFSLSPLTFQGMEPGVRVVLPSPNGAMCSRSGAAAPFLFLGALVNARAVAQAVLTILTNSSLAVTVVACGERWPTPSDDGDFRFALEDQLGAGAVLSHLIATLSPEAQVCAGAFGQAQSHLDQLLWDCGSGRELRDRGYGDDVRLAAQLDVSSAVPLLRDGAFTHWNGSIAHGL